MYLLHYTIKPEEIILAIFGLSILALVVGYGLLLLLPSFRRKSKLLWQTSKGKFSGFVVLVYLGSNALVLSVMGILSLLSII